MSDDSALQPTSNLTEFLKLLQRFRQSLTGLLLLEIGWTTLLILASKLSGGEAGGYKIADIPLDHIWMYGAILIFIGWAVYSRLYAYLVVPAFIASKPIIDLIFILIAAISLGLDQLRNRRIAPRRQQLIKQWLEEHRETTIQKMKEKSEKGKTPTAAGDIISAEQLHSAYDKWLADFKEEHGEDALERLANEKISVQPDYFARAIRKIGDIFLTPINSSIRVGIAPFTSYPSGDTLVAPRSAIEQFGSAIASIISQLAHIKGIEHVHFFPLPAHFLVRTHAQAGLTIRLFNLDVLVWGEFSEDLRRANAYFSAKATSVQEDDENSSSKTRHDLAFFPITMPLDVSALRFSTSDQFELQIVLIVALLKAFENRAREKFLERKQNTKSEWAKLWQTFKSAFTAYGNFDGVTRKILEHLAWKVLPGVKKTKAEHYVIPSARTVSADLVSKWVGYILGSDETRGKYSGLGRNRPFLTRLYSVAQGCSMILPEDPATFFRLGALSCLLGEVETARSEFQRAGKLDEMYEYESRIPPLVDAEMDFDNWAKGSSYYDMDVLAARFAANAIAAIYDGRVDNVKELMKGGRLRKEEFYFNWDRTIDSPDEAPPAFSVVNSFLEDPSSKAPG